MRNLKRNQCLIVHPFHPGKTALNTNVHHKKRLFLNHFWLIFPFYNLWKHQVFLCFQEVQSGNIYHKSVNEFHQFSLRVNFNLRSMRRCSDVNVINIIKSNAILHQLPKFLQSNASFKRDGWQIFIWNNFITVLQKTKLTL